MWEVLRPIQSSCVACSWRMYKLCGSAALLAQLDPRHIAVKEAPGAWCDHCAFWPPRRRPRRAQPRPAPNAPDGGRKAPTTAASNGNSGAGNGTGNGSNDGNSVGGKGCRGEGDADEAGSEADGLASEGQPGDDRDSDLDGAVDSIFDIGVSEGIHGQSTSNSGEGAEGLKNMKTQWSPWGCTDGYVHVYRCAESTSREVIASAPSLGAKRLYLTSHRLRCAKLEICASCGFFGAPCWFNLV